MKITPQVSICLTLAVATLTTASPAQAALNGPTYPAPGGTTFTAGSGDTGKVGGKTNSYSGFNSSSYSDLYWGLDDTTDPSLSFSITGGETGGTPYSGSEFMTYSPGLSNFATGTVVWTGSSVLEDINGSPPNPTVPTEFILNVTDNANNPLALTSASSLGLPSKVGGVLHVVGDYKVNLQFEGAYPTSTYQPALTMFNSYHHPNDPTSHYDSSFSGGFYYTPPSAAPEPGQFCTLGLVAIGLGSLLLRARKQMHRIK